ncbi:transketolase [Brachybacterium muris]|uniref:transketolase n=1 Tax=Brachybacterium muris TaxID=219301 RepID=UPI00223AA70C|nr:transketolase [Brachybacterium muris]MCT2176342.1 transketolase [Brachybacterium muris]MCT2261630.1 transketolase [Brachybacterium muris]
MTDTFKAPEGWTELDRRAVDTARVLAADAVEKVGNGHPGTAMSLAPAAYLLYQDVMRHDPADSRWLGRDKFVLSAGHSSLTQYIQLFFGGFGLEIEDIEALRTYGSKTPGHPEYHHTDGIETTTGPLGQGIATAVGMAMAQRRERGLLDPDAAPGQSPFDHFVYVIASDGDMQEGISNEASSIAGTQQLGNLIVLWDDNHITIEGHTDIAFTEDTAARYEALGWHVQTVDWTNGGTEYVEDVAALKKAIEEAQKVTDKPSFIDLRTIIGWPTPELQGTHKVHGNKLGTEAVKAVKEVLGFDPAKDFEVADEVLAHTRELRERGAEARRQWDEKVSAWREANPERATLLDRLSAQELPEGWAEELPTFEADAKGVATRAASGTVLNALAAVLPELWGGSADLAGSNNTTMEGEPSFIPAEHSTDEFTGTPYGRTLHFGIREHAMGAILSGITIGGLTRAYGGTFLQFSDYMRPAVRLASLMGVPSIYVWTHDSIGLGEDGPTHQPIEHLAALRAIPGLSVVRPADANETAAAWKATLEHRDGPVGLILTRQAVPTFDRSEYAGAEGLARGAYVMKEAEGGEPQLILLATGSEVQIAAEAQKQLESEGVPTRLVSVPSFEWFDAQDEAYRESVLPKSVRARVSVEAGIAMPWFRYLGDAGRAVSVETYGASADYKVLFEKYGVTPEAVVKAAHESIAAAKA